MTSARDVFVRRFAARDATRTEADIQSDIYGLLTAGDLNLAAEQVAKVEPPITDGTRRRLDIEIGHLAIEVKKDLRTAGIKKDAEIQLGGYVTSRTESTGSRYVGLLTDGTSWHLYNSEGDSLIEVAHLDLDPSNPDVDRLVTWLEAVLSTQTQVKPTPEQIKGRLGAESPAHLLDHAALHALYESAGELADVQLKRELWAKLLKTAFGSTFDDSQRLFLDHTLLVLSAEIIAHAVLGFNVSATGGITPRNLTLGTEFANAQIYGVVQADFFDWVLDVPGGEAFIASLARRIAQFDWSSVQHDVLKVLYESVIEQAERARLGEYYTPDWLADRMVAEHVPSPLSLRILDPACGSGTFLFHGIRAYLSAAESEGISIGAAVKDVTSHVIGMDIHPVAVTLARVTYLLAIGRDRLNANDRPPLSIPVYLGDSMQWEQRVDVFAHEGNVTVSTQGTDLVEAGDVLFEDDLVFPRSVLQDASAFDQLVTALADKSADTSDRSSRAVIMPALKTAGVPEDALETLVSTFDVMRRLHASGRDHIWGYYVKNLIRPIWMAEPKNRVDVLIGNPPWLSYSKMTKAMQKRFTLMSRERGLIPGAKGASGRDLSTTFVVRTAELYLRHEGRFAFVMPHGILRGQPHSAFRSGVWHGPTSELTAEFLMAWDLSRAATGFPMTSCVISGVLTAGHPKALSESVQLWKTTGTKSNVSWSEMEPRLTVSGGTVRATAESDQTPNSPYKSRFRQGAVIAPRVLFIVEDLPAGPLGAGAGRVAIQSSRKLSSEKAPWKHQASISGVVEKAFVKPAIMGGNVVPFAIVNPVKTVLPISVDGTKLLSPSQIESHDGLVKWWQSASQVWDENKSKADEGSLLDRADFHGQLSAQLPPAPHRVVYSASGSVLVAARVEDAQTVVEHKLYWSAVSSVAEARYLVAVLNSDTVLARVRPFQNLGLFGPRDFDKNVFRAPIPPFDDQNPDHVLLANLAEEAEIFVAKIDLGTISAKSLRSSVHSHLTSAGLASKIDEVVARVIPEVVIG